MISSRSGADAIPKTTNITMEGVVVNSFSRGESDGVGKNEETSSTVMARKAPAAIRRPTANVFRTGEMECTQDRSSMKLLDQEQDEPHKHTIHQRLNEDLLHAGEIFNREIRLEETEQQEQHRPEGKRQLPRRTPQTQSGRALPAERRILT